MYHVSTCPSPTIEYLANCPKPVAELKIEMELNQRKSIINGTELEVWLTQRGRENERKHQQQLTDLLPVMKSGIHPIAISYLLEIIHIRIAAQHRPINDLNPNYYIIYNNTFVRDYIVPSDSSTLDNSDPKNTKTLSQHQNSIYYGSIALNYADRFAERKLKSNIIN